MRNGAAHTDIGQDRVAEIEFQRVRARIAFIAARGHFKARVAAQPREISDGKCGERAEQQLPGFHLRRRRRTVRHHAPDHAVQIGHVVAPVIRVAIGDDELPAFILHEAERAGAHRRRIGRVLANIGAFINVLRGDIAKIRQRAQQQVQRHGPAVAEDRGMRVWRINRLQE